MEEKSRTHKVLCLNRQEINVSGVSKVNSATEKHIILSINKEQMFIYGVNMHVNKLDVEQGNIEIVGIIDTIKYSKTNNVKEGFFKRIFK